MKLELPCRVSLFTGYSIGLPVLRQSLIPSSLLVVFIVVIQTVAKRVLPVRLTIASEEAQEPVGSKKLLSCRESYRATGVRNYKQINNVLLLWDFCNMSFPHYKNRNTMHAILAVCTVHICIRPL